MLCNSPNMENMNLTHWVIISTELWVNHFCHNMFFGVNIFIIIVINWLYLDKVWNVLQMFRLLQKSPGITTFRETILSLLIHFMDFLNQLWFVQFVLRLVPVWNYGWLIISALQFVDQVVLQWFWDRLYAICLRSERLVIKLWFNSERVYECPLKCPDNCINERCALQAKRLRPPTSKPK